MTRLSDNTIEAILERMGKSYRALTPRHERKSATWDLLVQELHRADSSLIADPVVPYSFSFSNVLFGFGVLRPAFATLVVFLFVGGVLLSAAEASLPGDSLYTLKLVRERATIRLKSDGVDRTAFAVRLATKRANEVQAVVASDESREVKQERLKVAVAGLHSSVNEATDVLTRTSEKKQLADVVAAGTANMVGVLQEAKAEAAANNGDVAATVNDALAFVAETSEAVRIAAAPPTDLASSLAAAVNIAVATGTAIEGAPRTFQVPSIIVPPQSVFALPLGISVNSPRNLPLATSIYGELPFAASVQSNPGF